MLLRPESVVVARNGAGIEAVVVRQSFHGPSFRVVLRAGDQEILADVRAPLAPGTRLRIEHSGVAPFFPESAS